MSDSKIQIKVGIVEFSGEGNQEWLGSQLDKILSKIPELLKIEMSFPEDRTDGKKGDGKKTPIKLAVGNVAAKLKAKSGQDVATAAAAYLQLVEGKTTFSRDDILTTMKKATGYFKTSFTNNLTNILVGLVKNNTLTQSSTDIYSLNADKEAELNGILAK